MSDKYEKLDTDGKDVADDNFERQKDQEGEKEPIAQTFFRICSLVNLFLTLLMFIMFGIYLFNYIDDAGENPLMVVDTTAQTQALDDWQAKSFVDFVWSQTGKCP